MPVQRFSLPTLPSICASAWLALAGLGCAHEPVESETPSAEASAEIDALRRENASLRTRIQNLEEELRLLEREDDWAVATRRGGEPISLSAEAGEVEWDQQGWEQQDTSEGPKELPVIKLTPKERSIESRPAAAPEPPPTSAHMGRRASVSLSTVPNSGAPDYGRDDPALGDYVDARGDAGAPSEAADGETASYRLVGSKLVQATKESPRQATAKGSRGRGGPVVREYEAAMSIYRDGRYADAEQAFEAIVTAHPDHDYADNALYWQGEAAYDQAHYADALAAFTAVVERYGGGNKAPDALLKIGLCYGRLGDAANARDVLTQLVAAYPRSNASKIAKRKLAELDD
ncbi:tol-pal system protein YbgF [Pseudenhygromyxa sp. WMMC2535]|uniref:tol-pal system protein YbgF n=1 Tax=Pseudenhygromyxa sp. WMMC2535 TaxID=2712867 RepID=UPI001556F108|nr:tol-pal system protein YbgF [Pseudenhygromyxa sp. WMMC2535]NVB40398.1 tol-pal system protein YbgF [Pseudenhygromyxa sp. WMMC2535]